MHKTKKLFNIKKLKKSYNSNNIYSNNIYEQHDENNMLLQPGWQAWNE